MKNVICFAVLFAIAMFSACQPAGNNAPANNSSIAGNKGGWDAYVDQYLNDYFAANPTSAVYQGKHEYDGKFPDWSDEGLKKDDRASESRA